MNLFHMAAPTRPHGHEHWEWGYVLRGRLRLSAGKRSIPLEAGSVFLIPPALRHSETPLSGARPQVIYLHLAKSAEALTRSRKPSGREHGPWSTALPPRHLVATLFKEIFQEWRHPGPGHGALLAAWISVLARQLLRLKAGWVAKERASPHASLVKRAADIADNRFRDPGFHSRALAAELGVSARWLEKVLGSELGESPGRFLRQYRMGAAEDELRGGEETVRAIAHRCGFHSEGTFIRAFRLQHGQTPGNWRRAAQAVVPHPEREGGGAPAAPGGRRFSKGNASGIY
ncbi:MAG: helix-turn-helix domain-containing protein [Spirochaetes bacterium]|nr:helix-turn-helix domain-containing protein [Spirochaetota bacterium]